MGIFKILLRALIYTFATYGFIIFLLNLIGWII